MKKFILISISLLIFIPEVLFSIPQKTQDTMDSETKYQIITLGAGCYWCVEAIFERVNGIVEAVSGFSGGSVKNPTYKEVCSGTTGHAEVIQLKYDPNIVSLTEILEIFFKTHDPTTLNRQGGDVGTQYRSAVFYHTEEQKSTAKEIIASLNAEKIWVNPIVTEITPFSVFYPAHDSHQEYFENNPNQGYCRMHIQPKVQKFEKLFKDKLK